MSELRTTMSELGNMLTDEEISAFIAIMDVDGDGVIGVSCHSGGCAPSRCCPKT